MKSNHVPSFLMTHSAVAVVVGLLCAWVIGLGTRVQVVVLGRRLGAGLLVSAGAVSTLLMQRIGLWGWRRYVRAQASEALLRDRRISPAMAAPAAPADLSPRLTTARPAARP